MKSVQDRVHVHASLSLFPFLLLSYSILLSCSILLASFLFSFSGALPGIRGGIIGVGAKQQQQQYSQPLVIGGPATMSVGGQQIPSITKLPHVAGAVGGGGGGGGVGGYGVSSSSQLPSITKLPQVGGGGGFGLGASLTSQQLRGMNLSSSSLGGLAGLGVAGVQASGIGGGRQRIFAQAGQMMLGSVGVGGGGIGGGGGMANSSAYSQYNSHTNSTNSGPPSVTKFAALGVAASPVAVVGGGGFNNELPSLSKRRSFGLGGLGAVAGFTRPR